MIKFIGRYAELKALGFRFQKLYDNQIYYTTWDTGSASDIWIRKAFGGVLWFDENNLTVSHNALKALVANDFSNTNLCYNSNTLEVREIEQNELLIHISGNGEWIRVYLKKKTIQTLEQMYRNGWLEI